MFCRLRSGGSFKHLSTRGFWWHETASRFGPHPTNDAVLLLDEPFSSLDFDVKLKVQRYLIDYQHRGGTTIILVTHDVEDAIALSNEVIVLSSKPANVKAVI